MSSINISSSTIGGSLEELLVASDIQPGDVASYNTCKAILLYHPLGLKMTRSPVVMALSKPREITVADGPEEECVEQFNHTWRDLDVDQHIVDLMTLSRAYGAAAVTIVIEGEDPDTPLDLRAIGIKDLTFNILDPLNTAGSMVSNQDPNTSKFLRPGVVNAAGVRYHKSRTFVKFNEQPIYLAYTPSAFGFAGRSVYQRALFPMKTYIRTMQTDDLVTGKAGVLVAKLKGVGSVVDNVMAFFNQKKREILKQAKLGNVINIGHDDAIETLNMQNLEAPMIAARKNVLENIATAADMPAVILNQETFAEGFGEGTEDAKAVVRWLDNFRREMQPIFRFFDRIVMYRAWTPEFFQSIQARFPAEYGALTYDQAFYRWANSFKATDPSLMEEPESEKVEVEKVKFEAANSAVQLWADKLDPTNLADLMEWYCDVINSTEYLFPSPLNLDPALAAAHMQEEIERKKALEAQAAMMGGDNSGGDDFGGDERPRPKLVI